MNEENDKDPNDNFKSVLLQVLKVIGIVFGVLLLLVVLGLGLLVGFCALINHH